MHANYPDSLAKEPVVEKQEVTGVREKESLCLMGSEESPSTGKNKKGTGEASVTDS